jgi:tetratricopeptide (TPR) repeat protein
MGHHRRAADYLSRTMHAPQGDLLSQRFGSSAMPAIVSRTWMAWSLAELGAFAEGMASGAEAIQMAEAIGHPYSLVTASFGLGLLYLRRGDLDKAIAVLEHGVDVCNAWGFHVLAFHGVAAFLGTAYVVAGRVAEALPMLERVVEQTDAMGAIVNYVLGVIPLGEGYLRAGRVDDALRHAQHAVEVCRQHQQRGHLAWALRLLGEVAAQHDPPQLEEAADYYRQALALAEDLSMRPLQAHCHLSLGKLALQTGRHDAARVELTAAIELYRAMEMTFWLPEAERALAEVHGH